MVQQVYIIIATNDLEIIKSSIQETQREIEVCGITFYRPDWSIQLFQVLRQLKTDICFCQAKINNDYLTNLLIDSLRGKNQVTFDILECSLTTFNLLLKLDVKSLIFNKYLNEISDKNFTCPGIANKHIGPAQIQALTFSNCNLAFFTHWPSLIDFSHITSLRLINCKLTDYSIKFLSQSITQSLKSLDLSENLLTRKSLIYLMKNQQFTENIVNIQLKNNFIDVDQETLKSFYYNIQLDSCQNNINALNIKLFSIASDSKENMQNVVRLSTELFLSNVNQLSRFTPRFASFIQNQNKIDFNFTQQETEKFTAKQILLLAPFINWLTIYDENALNQNLMNHRFIHLESKCIGQFYKMLNIQYLKLDKSYTEREIQLLCTNLDKIIVIDASQSILYNGIDLFDKIPSLQLLITQDKILCQKEDTQVNFQDEYEIIIEFLKDQEMEKEMWQYFKLTSRQKAEIQNQANQVKTLIVEQQMGRMPPQDAQKSISTSSYYQAKIQGAIEASAARQAEKEQLLATIMMSKRIDRDAGYKTVYPEEQPQQQKQEKQLSFGDYIKQKPEIQEQQQQQQLQQQQQNIEQVTQIDGTKPLFAQFPIKQPEKQIDQQDQLTTDQLIQQTKQVIEQSNAIIHQTEMVEKDIQTDDQQQQKSPSKLKWRKTTLPSQDLLFDFE